MQGNTPTLFGSHLGQTLVVSVTLLAGAVTPVGAHEGNSPDRYVAPDGVDAGDCHDPERPCRTILYAIGKASKGDRLLVAGGTYLFDPAEVPLLLSEMVRVRGGYSVGNHFAAQAAEANPTYIIGPSFEYREALAERGLILVQDPKGLAIAQDIERRAQAREGLQGTERPEARPAGQTLYVASNGTDEGDCNDLDRPCRTIRYAFDQAEPGDRILVAAGAYELGRGEASLLLSDEIPIRGGYSLGNAFAAQAAEANPTYIIGPSPELRDDLAARGLTLVQDPKGLQIERTIRERARVIEQEGAPVTLPPQGFTPCVDGRAGAYPCRGIDFLAHIPLEDFSSRPSAANDVWGFLDLNDSREYAIIGLHNGIAVVDVTDPLHPVEVGTIRGLGSIWRDIKVYQFRDEDEGRWKAYAYVTTDAAPQGLHILDLTELPERISLAATYRGFASAHNIYIANVDYATGRALPDLTAYAYVLGSNLDLGAFRILDLSNPIAPVEVTSPPPGAEYVHDATSLVITDGRTSTCGPGHSPCEVLVDYNEETVDLWDVTDKSNPLRLSSMPYEKSSYTHSGWWTKDKMFIFIQDELDERDPDEQDPRPGHGLNTTVRTVDISDLTAPFVSNVWAGPTRAIDHNGFTNGDRYYISNYRRGLTILDISDPNDPQEVAFFDTFPDPADDGPFFNGAWGTYPYLPSGTILVSDIEGGLFLLREQELAPAIPPLARGLGYAWADDATASRYAPSTTYSYNQSGGPIEITRSATGTYAVRFAGLGGTGTAGGHVQVTAYGPGSETCKVEKWSSSADDFVADVRCFDAAGNPADARYTVLAIGPELGEPSELAHAPSQGASTAAD
jgi:choice-of-anchor B domain-containing protein